MKKLTINRQVEKKIHKGYKILEKIDFGQLPFDNEVVELVTASGHFPQQAERERVDYG